MHCVSTAPIGVEVKSDNLAALCAVRGAALMRIGNPEDALALLHDFWHL
ncbi:hypothetical protein Z949_904 [Sulfitobacter guttiformis KCTC 32187]|nr:hypothetical protein Z949_904 [Sulfitobacter guttiformis KCTC 32187]